MWWSMVSGGGDGGGGGWVVVVMVVHGGGGGGDGDALYQRSCLLQRRLQGLLAAESRFLHCSACRLPRPLLWALLRRRPGWSQLVLSWLTTTRIGFTFWTATRKFCAGLVEGCLSMRRWLQAHLALQWRPSPTALARRSSRMCCFLELSLLLWGRWWCRPMTTRVWASLDHR